MRAYPCQACRQLLCRAPWRRSRPRRCDGHDHQQLQVRTWRVAAELAQRGNRTQVSYVLGQIIGGAPRSTRKRSQPPHSPPASRRTRLASAARSPAPGGAGQAVLAARPCSRRLAHPVTEIFQETGTFPRCLRATRTWNCDMAQRGSSRPGSTKRGARSAQMMCWMCIYASCAACQVTGSSEKPRRRHPARAAEGRLVPEPRPQPSGAGGLFRQPSAEAAAALLPSGQGLAAGASCPARDHRAAADLGA